MAMMSAIREKAQNLRVYQWVSFCHGVFRDGWDISLRRYQEKNETRRIWEEEMQRFELQETERKRQERERFPRPIRFNILVSLKNPSEKQLEALLQSVEAQTYGYWEMCLLDESDRKGKNTYSFLKEACKMDSRVRCRKAEVKDPMSRYTLWSEMINGDYYLLLDQNCTLHPATLYHAMERICQEDADLIYTDESNNQGETMFKPDFAPDSLNGNPYLGGMLMFSQKLAEECGDALRQALSRLDHYDMMLLLTEKATEKERKICHIPQNLCYSIVNPNAEEDAEAIAQKARTDKEALARHLERTGQEGKVLDSYAENTYRIRYAIQSDPLISILIPSKDHSDDLKKCIDSIFAKTTWKHFEILIVENGSTEEKTFKLYQELEENLRIRVLYWNNPFNFSGINNFAASEATGEYILMLNNDTEVLSPDWIQEMLMYAQREDVGAVGAKLYYPDGTIQHAGIGIGLMHSTGHFHRRFAGNQAGYMGRLAYAQDLSAVTGACMMVSRALFLKMGGMDESFPLVYNDVDFCLRLRSAGYLIVWTPFAELLHYESKTRGSDEETQEKKNFFRRESKRFQIRWNEALNNGDPYYNPNLTLCNEDFSPRALDYNGKAAVHG